ncbi:MAG: DUF5677 domain-containing protein [Anaerolineae bacterium]|nr:DUF5677 domain-containing protein [Anaerolineae bacterium]
MSDIEKDVQIEVDGLKYEIETAYKNVDDFGKRHFNGTRENALVFCLKRAADTAKGCEILAGARLSVPLYILTRSLFESLIWVYWIAMSDDNAQAFVNATANELNRLARKNLATGHAKVVDRITQEDKTQKLLESSWAKDISPRRKIENMAKEAGLGRIYTQLYGFLSMQAHGSTFGFESETSVEEDLLVVTASANVLMECINLVVKKWIVQRKRSSKKEIYTVLGINRQEAA